MGNGDGKVPDKVASSERLDQAAGPGVSPDTLLPVHRGALLVCEHDPKSNDADQGALEDGDNVRVPASPLALVGGIVLRRILFGDPRRYDELDKGVEESCGEDFVDVLRQNCHVVLLGKGPDPILEGGYRRYEERVLHGCEAR